LLYYANPYRTRGLKRLYAQFVAKNSLCFDVGSHIGNRVSCWRRLGARVVAIEPNSDCVRILRWLYGNDDQVAIHEMGLGSASGTGSLLIDEANPTVSTLSEPWAEAITGSVRFASVRYSQRRTVPIVTLDELIARHGSPDFVKIDVEGYESEVLLGLSQAIPALSFEYLPEATDAAVECIDVLERLGRYEYNYSRGESHVLANRQWIDGTQMHAALAGPLMQSDSGDIYARLCVAS